MKKTIIFLCLLAPMAILAQNNAKLDSLINEVHKLKKEIHQADSITKLILDGIYNNIDKPRYKMYQTQNQYILLKLDTRTGKVWQVQYRMKGVQSMVTSISYYGIVFETDGWDGRFELYTTNNIYTFIMIDTGTGDTYQVQWGISYEHRFVEKIE